jgi:membrane protein required for colicin V production
MDFSTLDIVLLIIMGVMAFRGLFNGLIRELFSFGSLIFGLLASMAFYKTLAGFFTEQFGAHTWNEGVAFFLVFIIIFAALKVIENIILKMMEETAAFSVDKGLGFVLGLLEGIVICSLVTYLINIQTIFNMDKMLNSSFFVPFFNKIFPFLESTSSAVMNKIKK